MIMKYVKYSRAITLIKYMMINDGRFMLRMHLHTKFELMYTRLRSSLATYFLRSHFQTCFYKYHESLANNVETRQSKKAFKVHIAFNNFSPRFL